MAADPYEPFPRTDCRIGDEATPVGASHDLYSGTRAWYRIEKGAARDPVLIGRPVLSEQLGTIVRTGMGTLRKPVC